MDNAQPNIPLMGNFKSNQEDGKKAFRQDPLDKGEPDTENKEEIQLSDILKPSTLISGIIILVLTVVIGWYVLVLKPALKDNESMIHFITPGIAPVSAPIKSQKNTGLDKSGLVQSLPTKTVAKLEPATSDTTKPSNVTETASPLATPLQSVVDSTQLQATANGAGSNKIASAKTSHWKKYKNHKHPRALNQRSWDKRNLKSSGFNSQTTCSQAQMAMQQCASNP